MNKPLRCAFLSSVMALIAGLLGACAVSDSGELAYMPAPPDKTPPNSTALVRTALYVDSGDPEAVQTLAAVPHYTLADTGTLYFDYVIISGAEIKQGRYSARLEYTAALMEIAKNWKTAIKPLRGAGIKVLLGIKGGRDGVSFGSLTKAQQQLFARECVGFCSYYGFDGVEFDDRGGESPGQTPYPETGRRYWNGEMLIDIPGGEDPAPLEDAWNTGAGNFADMMSYLIVSLGASSSFQGDIPPDAVERTPILVREVNFSRYLPQAVPRYAFASTLACLSYMVNSDTAQFGADNTGESALEFAGKRNYAPAAIDLAVIDPARLEEYSKRLGRRNYGQEEDEEPLNSEYGLVYYLNMRPPFAAYVAALSVTSQEVFGEDVTYTAQ